MNTQIVILAIILMASANGLQDICRALVLEGGGDLGAYEAGVLQGFVKYLPAEEVQWDVLSGVSVGALTAGVLSQYPKGQEPAAIEWLVNFWQGIDKSIVYDNWVPGGLLQGLIDEPGLFNTEPLKKTVKQYFNKRPERKLSIYACDINEGLYHRYEEDLTLEELQEAVITSASVPALFPWQSFKGAQLFDGGVCKMTDISGAIMRCRELVDSDDKIHLTLVYIASKHLEQWTGKETAMDSLNRYFQINDFRKAFRELTIAFDYYPQVQYDYCVYPQAPLPGNKFPFTFGKDRLKELVNIGQTDAKHYIDMGKGNSIHNFYEMAMRQQEQDHDISPAQAKKFREHSKMKLEQRMEKLAEEYIEI